MLNPSGFSEGSGLLMKGCDNYRITYLEVLGFFWLAGWVSLAGFFSC